MTRKNGRFLLNFLACIVFIASIVTGCNSGTESQETAKATSSYPDKTVTIVVPFAPGGVSDAHARVLERYFKDEFGQSLTFVYKPGAVGAVGATEVAKGKADGYTIMTANSPDIALQPLGGLGGFTIDDFQYLARVSSDPALLITGKESSYKTLDEFIQEAKKNPGKLTVASPPYSSLHLALLDLIERTGIDVTVVPYKDGAEVKAMILGGHVNAAMVNLSLMVEEMEKITALGVTEDKRYHIIPDVPTFKEQGYEIVSQMGRIYVTQKGVPAEIVERLRKGITKIVGNPNYQKDMANIGQPVNLQSGDDVDKMIHNYQDYAKDLLKKHNLLKEKK